MERIFVVEDDADINEIETIALKRSGYEVESCYDAVCFWEKMKESRQPDLILLDIMLEKEDGMTILRRLKSDPETADIPVIFVTAKTTELDKVRGLDCGADDYMTKPFGIMELISRVKAVLRRTVRSPRGGQMRVYEIGEIRVDDEQHVVFVGEQSIPLTFKEYELLKYLASRSHAVIPREELLEKIWGFDFEGESRTLDVHIMTLRKKLGECGNYIRTVKNVGYSLEDRIF